MFASKNTLTGWCNWVNCDNSASESPPTHQLDSITTATLIRITAPSLPGRLKPLHALLSSSKRNIFWVDHTRYLCSVWLPEWGRNRPLFDRLSHCTMFLHTVDFSTSSSPCDKRFYFLFALNRLNSAACSVSCRSSGVTPHNRKFLRQGTFTQQ